MTVDGGLAASGDGGEVDELVGEGDVEELVAFVTGAPASFAGVDVVGGSASAVLDEHPAPLPRAAAANGAARTERTMLRVRVWRSAE